MSKVNWKPGVTEKVTRRHMEGLQSVIQGLWKEWSEQYVINLRESHSKPRRHSATTPRVGQVVLVTNENAPRHHWSLGLITELKEASDGEIRKAVVRCKRNYIERSISHLIPLEVPEENEEQPENTENDTETLEGRSELSPLNMIQTTPKSKTTVIPSTPTTKADDGSQLNLNHPKDPVCPERSNRG
ncbi:unnamed protein product [Caenorhabditis sp. 36 PRJEB53466]|nr:unnamed protein product [Caenorhabditis sp. 36 PRJEB53466]